VAAPLLQAQIDKGARVQSLGVGIRFPPHVAVNPQCRWMKPLGPLRQGARTVNLNRRNKLFWTTTCTVTEAIPEQMLAFRVNANGTIWCYELQPIADGTRVIESRHAENGVKPVSSLAVNALFGGGEDFERGWSTV
jgi:hypothetical protein